MVRVRRRRAASRRLGDRIALSRTRPWRWTERVNARPPNILWIVTTQWRASATGYAGDPNAVTPCLDALAAGAVNYTQAVTPHPFGPFARAALFSGVPSPENGVRDYYDGLPVGLRTVAWELSARGYATGFFGKWHLAKRDPATPLVGEIAARQWVGPAERGGFDFWEGFEGGFMLNDLWLHGTRLLVPTRFAGYQSDVVAARARSWLGAEVPWFCVVSLESPHPPYEEASAGLRGRRASGLELRPNVPRGSSVEVRARRELAGYYGHIAATDRAIGELLDGLDAARTIVVFTSVHGDMHGAHGRFRKGWPYEESVRVPLLVRLPGRGPAVDAAAVSLVDLPAMTLAWADGASVAVRSAFSKISMPSVVRLPDQCDRVWSGLRSPERKLIFNADGTPWLYFDLVRDPWEQRNLAAEGDFAREMVALRAQLGGSDPG